METFEKSVNQNKNNINEYYLDEDHYTPLGHQLIAKELSKLIIDLLKLKAT